LASLSKIEPISAAHFVDEFDCGEPELTDWLRRFALTSHRDESARVYVTHRDGRVVGYYALATGAVARSEASPRIARGQANRPIPVIILARLAVDTAEQGRGLGGLLLRDALHRVASAANIVGVRALLIHAQNEDARAWYLRMAEFEESPVAPLQLMLLTKDLRRALG
jgi:GNAT superfamily N-acetyltransferase